jgi:DNA-binding MarR family transcriptional regulator
MKRAIRQTQSDSFKETLKTISDKQATVLKVVKDNLKMATNRMIAKELGWEINRVTGRVTELVNRGLLISAGIYKDKETNRTVTLWKYSH